jgi:hypothetical protein
MDRHIKFVIMKKAAAEISSATANVLFSSGKKVHATPHEVHDQPGPINYFSLFSWPMIGSTEGFVTQARPNQWSSLGYLKFKSEGRL